jgi:hypothetical protein
MRWIAFLVAVAVLFSAGHAEEIGSEKLYEPFNPFSPPNRESKADQPKDTVPNAATQRTDPPIVIWRAPKELVIHGAEHFNAADIRHKLLANLEVMDARHPLAPRDNYARVLANRCRAGYLHAGFCDVNIRGTLADDDSQAVLSITEGPWYSCGDVKVEGAVHFQPHELAKWLTTKQPPPDAFVSSIVATEKEDVATWVKQDGSKAELETAAWETTGPVRSDENDRYKIQEKITRGLAEMGLPWAQFEFQIVPSEKPLFKELHIRIVDEGPLATIEQIEVLGNKRDSADDIAKYLGVKPGMLITQSMRLGIWHKLWMSGRFRFQNVDLIRPTQPNESAKLQIGVWEYPPVTPLRTPLSEPEQIMFRCRDWLLDVQGRGDDFVVQWSGDTIATFVASPSKGVLFCGDLMQATFPAKLSEAELSKRLPIIAFALRPDRLTFTGPAFARRLESIPLDGRLLVNWGMQPVFKPEEPDADEFQILLGTGYNSSKDTRGTSIEWRINIAPVAALAVLYRHEPKCSIEGNVLTVATEMNMIRIDAKTGALISMRRISEHDPGTIIDAGFHRDAYESEFSSANKRVGNRLTSAPNALDSRRPLSSAVEFLSGDAAAYTFALLEKASIDARPFAQLLHKFSTAGFLRPLDDWAVEYSKRTEEPEKTRFEIPQPPSVSQWGSVAACIRIVAEQTAKWKLPENSWPAILLRTASGVGMGRTKYVESDLRLLMTRENYGPLARLVTAELLVRGHHPAAARFAQSGLRCLSADKFCQDCQVFLDSGNQAGQFVDHLGELLRKLDEDEATGLGELILKDNGGVLVAVVKALRENPKRSTKEVISQLLPVAWKACVRGIVEQRLRELAGETFAEKPMQDEATRK